MNEIEFTSEKDKTAVDELIANAAKLECVCPGEIRSVVECLAEVLFILCIVFYVL